ncbi:MULTISPECIES: hypothetical protein [Xanthomonas]|uniref:hypothetical protein n=1 Tax=Xanthomonas TaxID=338 RepID=UPI001264507E|nr:MULTISPECIES: hypothetical protein [Xanthomonas]MCW0388625.1 hypothetical protein [Xanthomonas sacchari]MCW0454936.1 hypothetical protein [Xanthomonas sacchari]
MSREILYAVQGAVDAKSWEEIWLPPIVTILGVLITVLVTAWVTLKQLKQQESISAKNRLIETKREVILEGVRGMYRAHAAFGRLSNFNVSDAEILLDFQEGMSRISTASAVASLETVTAGRNFTQMFGPIFIRMFVRRMNIKSAIGDSGGDYRAVAGDFVRELTEYMPALVDAQAEVLAAVRQDIDIDRNIDVERFRVAAKVDQKIVLQAVDDALKGQS